MEEIDTFATNLTARKKNSMPAAISSNNKIKQCENTARNKQEQLQSVGKRESFSPLSESEKKVARLSQPITSHSQPIDLSPEIHSTPSKRHSLMKKKKPLSRLQPVIPNTLKFQLVPVREGYLFHKKRRRWIILDKQNIYIFKSIEVCISIILVLIFNFFFILGF